MYSAIPGRATWNKLINGSDPDYSLIYRRSGGVALDLIVATSQSASFRLWGARFRVFVGKGIRLVVMIPMSMFDKIDELIACGESSGSVLKMQRIPVFIEHSPYLIPLGFFELFRFANQLSGRVFFGIDHHN
jgi:hypothetical protein